MESEPLCYSKIDSMAGVRHEAWVENSLTN
jgi:hypothetical protein